MNQKCLNWLTVFALFLSVWPVQAAPAAARVVNRPGRAMATLPAWFRSEADASTPSRVSGERRAASLAPLPNWFPPAAPAGAPAAATHHTIREDAVTVTGPGQVNNCDVMTFTLRVTNDAVTATHVLITSSMPSGFNPSQQVFDVGTVGPNETITRTAVYTATCDAVSGQHTTRLSQDGAGDVTVYTDFVVNPGAITVLKDPAVIEAALDDVVTWVVTLENTGYGQVSNVMITDVLGSGLAYVSGLTTDAAVALAPGEVLTWPVSARVVGCSDLQNEVVATWGCGTDNCLLPQTALGSIDLQMRNPNLEYVLPPFDVPYCAGSQTFTIPISNVGDGTAYSGTLETTLAPFDVSTAPGVSYDGAAFHLPPIPPGDVYDLVFTMTLPADLCPSQTNGSFDFGLDFYDRCGNLYLTSPQLAPWQLSAGVGQLDVSKSMPGVIERGEVITAYITVDVQDISGTVAVTDALPLGWRVIDAGGGITAPGRIYWTLTETTRLTVVLDTPDATVSGCAACGTQMTNIVTATASDCRACTHVASASASSYIHCSEGIVGDKVVSGPLTPCDDETYTYTSTYTFGDTFVVTPTWSGLVYTDTLPDQTCVSGTASVTVDDGVVSCTATFSESIVGGMLVIDHLSPTCGITLPGATLQIVFQAQLGEPEACSDVSFYDWSYLNLGVTGYGECTAEGSVEHGVRVETRAPAMSLALDGLPSAVSSCDVYTVTLRATRTTPDVPAYDVALDLVTDTYAVVDVLGFAGLTPAYTTTDHLGYHWYYSDAFAAALTATVDLRVQLRCADAAPFEGTLYYDNRCADNDTYRERCSAGGGLANPRFEDCSPIMTKFPEIIYAKDDLLNWTLLVFNAGAGPAHHVTLTDTLGSGLRYVASTITSTQGSVAGVTPLTSTHLVTWHLPVIQPKERVRIEYQAEIISCENLTNTLYGQQGCLEEACHAGCLVEAEVVLPNTVLLNTNSFVSPLDTCYTRTVTATVRNAGLLSVYSATLQEDLPAELYYVTGTTEVSTDTVNWQPGPNPDIVGQSLSWGPGSGPPLDDWLGRVRPGETVYVRFQTVASCPFAGGLIEVQTAYLDPCGDPHSTQSSSYLMEARYPELTFVKSGENLSRTLGTPERVFAEPGEPVVWTLTVTNDALAAPATHVTVSDTLPSNLAFITATNAYSLSAPALGALGGVVSWTLGTVDPGATVVLTVSTRVQQPDGCTPADTLNQADLSWGCDDGCRVRMQAQAELRTRPVFEPPVLATELQPNLINVCGGALTVTLNNDGPPAYDVVLTDTLPDGFVYSDTLYVSAPPSSTIDLGQTVVFTWAVLPSGLTTLALRVHNAHVSGTCTLPAGSNQVEILYNDDISDCFSTLPYSLSASAAVNVVVPNLALTKTPAEQVAQVGERVTWTLTLENNGAGAAYNVLVTDVVGSSFANIAATAGGVVASPQVTWMVGELAAGGGSWSAQVSAVLTDTGDNFNVVTATAYCDMGCRPATASNQAHVSLSESFQKGPEIQTGTIGSLVHFEFALSKPDRDALYEDFTLIDRLPPGLGYLGAVLTYTYDADGNAGGPFPQVATPTSAPAALETGDVTWDLGLITGTVEAQGILTAVILDGASNYDGVRISNLLELTYREGGRAYVITDSADVDIVEPVLHLGKSYVTPQGCAATRFQEDFNDVPDGGAPGGAWSRVGTWQVNDGILESVDDGNNRRAFAGVAGWTDYSYSFMVRTPDPDGAIGAYWRQNANGAEDRGYRLHWTTSQLRLQSRDPGAWTLALENFGYTVNRWYHVEVQVVGNQMRVYVDGVLRLSYTDPAARHPLGRVGLYAHQNAGAQFDDVLVTRLDDMACLVGAGDRVTYTLFVSNQSRLPGYDLLITDVVPSAMRLVSYTMSSNDPTPPAVVREPAPIPGATGTLVWGVDHLTPTAPFDPARHTALTLTVVMSVSEAITANTVMANHAFLTYDNWLTDTQPTTVTRAYSGGTHATAVRTIDGRLTKTLTFAPPPSPTLGSVITYLIQVPAPPISATLYDVLVTDSIDARMQLETVTDGPDGTVDIAGNAFTVTYPAIPAGQARWITATAVLSGPLGALPGDRITNVATLSHTAGLTESDEAVYTVTAPSLVLTKASEPPTSNTVGVGDVVTYSVRVSNAGPFAAPAYDLRITDTQPAHVSFLPPLPFSLEIDGVPLSASDYVSAYAGGVLTLDVADAISLPVGGELLLVYRGRVDADVPAGEDQINAAQVACSSLPGAVPGDRDFGPVGDDTNVHAGWPALELAKSAVPVPAEAGRPLTYTLRVTNTGLVSATGVVITDQLPADTAYQSCLPTPCGHAAGVVSWTLGTLHIGAPWVVTMVVGVSPSAGDQIVNRAGVTSSERVTDTDTLTTPLQARADLSVVKLDTPDPVAAGTTLTYTLLYTNHGPADAQAVLISDTLPGEVVWGGMVSAVPSLFGPTQTAQWLTWSTPTLPAGVAGQIVFSVTVRPDVSGRFTNTVVISTTTTETDTDNNDDDEPTDTRTAADLVVRKSDDPDPVVAGATLTYTLVYTNYGPSDAQAVRLTDTLPLSVTYGGLLSVVPPLFGPTQTGRLLTWSTPTLPAGATGQIVFSVTLGADVTGSLTNGVLITSSTPETDTDNNDDDEPSTVHFADVWVLKDVEPTTPVRAGDVITWIVTYGNDGLAPADAVTISDTLPADVTWGGVVTETPPIDGPALALPTLTWTTPTLAPGASGSIVFTTTANVATSLGNVLTNSVRISTTTPETDTTNNDDTARTPVLRLAVQKIVDRSPVLVGETVRFTLRVSNTGGYTLTTVPLTDTYDPTYLRFLPPADPPESGAAPGVITWTNVGPLAPGVDATLVLTFTALTVTHGAPTVNWVTTTGTYSDTVLEPVDDSDEVEIIFPLLALIKRSENAGGDPLQPGERLTYTLRISNLGRVAATNVTVSDTLPAFTTWADHVTIAPPSAGGTPGTPPVIARGITVAAHSQVSVTYAVTVVSPLTDGTPILNTAAVTSTEVSTPTVDTVTDTVQAWHTLAVTKTVTPRPAAAGGLLTYTLSWSVAGNAPAPDLTLSDTLPLSTTYQRCPGAPCDVDGRVVRWHIGTVDPPAAGAVTLTVRLDPRVPDGAQVANSVTLTDGTGLTDTAEITLPVRWTNVSVTKVVTPPQVVSGDRVTYTLAYTNEGPAVAQDVTVVDVLPDALRYAGAVPSPTVVSGPVLTWHLGTLGVGATGRITLLATVHPTFTPYAALTNTVRISTSTSETDEDDNEDDATVILTQTVGLEINKSVLPALGVDGQTLTYSVRLTNTGNVPLNPVRLDDRLPPGFVYNDHARVYPPPAGAPLPPDLVAEPTVVWNDVTGGAGLAAGASLTLTFRVTVATGVTGTFVNVVTATGTTPTGVVTDTDDAPVQIEDPAVDVSKRLSGHDRSNGIVTFTVSITNVGPSTLDVLPLLDAYDPAYLSFADAAPYPEQDVDDGLLSWYDLTGPAPHGFGRDLAPGERFVLTTVFSIVREITATTNVVTVTGATDEHDNIADDDDGDAPLVDVPTAITLRYLRATAHARGVRVEWATLIERDSYGFWVYRAVADQFAAAIPLAFQPSQGTGAGATYTHLDQEGDVEQRYWYWLVEVDNAGVKTRYGPVTALFGIQADEPYRFYLPLVTKG